MLHPSSSAANPPAPTNFMTSDPTKYAVADILSSFASGEPSTPNSLGIVFSGATSSTSDLLTPTTLANLEQTFDALQNSFVVTTQANSISRESGFVPPIVEPIRPQVPTMVKQEYPQSYSYQDESSSDQDPDWYPSEKRPRYEQLVMQAGYGSPQQGSSSNSPRRRKSRDTNISPDEAQKRAVRRERNKLAAAKCRQRRVDLTNTLINESEGLEDEQAKLENEIQMLNQQKEQLEFLLEAHKPVCSAKLCSRAPTGVSSSVKAETLDLSYPSVLTPTVDVGTSCTSTMTSFAGASRAVMSTSRPQSLNIPASVSVTTATGVAITTPSSVFNLGLDIMMDGHTGLTPITGTPSCGSQLQRNSTEGSSSSPDMSSPTLMAL